MQVVQVIEVGVVFYAASLAAAAAIGWFTRAVFLFRCKHCGRVVPVVAPQQQRLLDGPSSSRNGAPSAEGAAAKSAARRYPAVFGSRWSSSFGPDVLRRTCSGVRAGRPDHPDLGHTGRSTTPARALTGLRTEEREQVPDADFHAGGVSSRPIFRPGAAAFERPAARRLAQDLALPPPGVTRRGPPPASTPRSTAGGDPRGLPRRAPRRRGRRPPPVLATCHQPPRGGPGVSAPAAARRRP